MVVYAGTEERSCGPQARCTAILETYLELQRGVQWRSLGSVGASIGYPFEGAGIYMCVCVCVFFFFQQMFNTSIPGIAPENETPGVDLKAAGWKTLQMSVERSFCPVAQP